MSSTIDEGTKVGLKLVMWGAGTMLGVMSPALALAINASLKVGTFAEILSRTEHNTAVTASALQTLGIKYEGESARLDGRMSAAERELAELAARIRELEQRR